MLLSTLSGLLLTGIYLALQEPILTLFGGRVNEETFRQAKEYFFWITLGVGFALNSGPGGSGFRGNVNFNQ